ncbi:MAG: TRAP transporter substrate-binding protein [Roseomonas mucosa]|nr:MULTISPECIES: TRAP transporter substrate-binding protein [Roseomonas]MBS5904359.1 TRAP transporter substrate-binding protein [Acetobacteraceae bacterium]MDT8264787.1 TRAP transporter substrate-binding protein [Roseomonas sp. DSM 102946]MCG7351344.1 TRAP transporter substrate-binding protein [Roseomonas mucosa]MCG7356856.1 TRAP transporter substrate-binding protein [Roseomonas mucosa]MDT8277533.1 TRAP transporter substrate-binding protein [Roseomonas mucosa]
MTTRRALMAMTPLLGLATFPARAEAAEWGIATEYPATAMPGEGIAFFAETANLEAQGILHVRPAFDAPDGLRSARMPGAVAQGKPEAADAFTGALAGLAPILQLSALPFLTGSADDTRRLLEAARPAYVKVLSERGLTLLYATPWPATGLWSRRPVTGPESLKGLRVRTYDESGTTVMRAAGAEPSQISFADALPRLKSGEMDAVLSSGDGGAGARLWEILPHFTAIDYAWPLSLAFCNTAALQRLPEAGQAAVARAGKATEARQFKAIETRMAENEARMRTHGMTIATSPALRAALEAAAAPVQAAWVQRAGPEGEAILRAYRGGR